MKISELITLLEGFKQRHGDIDTRCDALFHSFPPRPMMRTRAFKIGKKVEIRKIVVLNP